MIKKFAPIIIVGFLAIIGVSFINYRKKQIKKTGLMFEGIEEVGSNQGFTNAAFEKMMRDVGWKDGEEWCSYFAKLVYINALPKFEDDIRKWFSGSSQRTFENVQSGKTDKFEIVEGRPKKGDVVIWQRKAAPSKGHVGVVVKTYAGNPNKFDAVEGNTNYDPAFSGDGQLVDVVPHETAIGETDSVYKSLRLRGFIRLK
jgi:hypothetical protein